ncbi:terminase small subunit, partial [Eubacteriales bacterium OttesenSCG-928-M02]|nr:terminase small subunit [Eubacteriales bacterium OttesenSCG-928-M02]
VRRTDKAKRKKKKVDRCPYGHGPEDVIAMYERIAFYNVCDYIKFGTRIEGGKEVSYIAFQESILVDGMLPEEVSIGAGGIPKIKLPDRMKALEKLERYFDLLPDTYQRELEERKLLAKEQEKEREAIEVITRIPRPDEAV